MFSYNTTVHSSTKFTPFELLFGHSANLPSSLTSPPGFKYTYEDYLDELFLKLRKSHTLAKEHLVESKNINKKYFDRNAKLLKFDVGDKVYMLNENKKIGKSKKLSPNYNGPYKIISRNHPNYTILVGKNRKAVHSNLLKRAFVLD